ncbi:MAG: acetate/propionate family kinase [Phycisphaerales bacterium]|nr:acetate/propionate family kinase [Phycisphaerales bacterium]
MSTVGAGPIVVVNAGSSSIKISVHDGDQRVCRGLVERIGVAGTVAHVDIRDGTGRSIVDEKLSDGAFSTALRWLLERLPDLLGGRAPRAVGHRVVHGGTRFTAPMRVTPALMAQARAYAPLAPLHLPPALAVIDAFAARSPDLPQVACFDTAFHATQDPLATYFALPRRFYDEGIRRYGFHGLSYEFIAWRLREIDPRAADGRTVVCHLGNGSSMCALRAGRSVATTMGFSAIEGLPMGTRCGSIDPAVVLYLQEHDGLTVGEVADLLHRQSGLLGLSGVSSDMRALLASDRPEAAEAVEYYCYRIARELGSLAATLDGLDALVFTAGIGEHAAPVRSKVAQRARWLGVEFDESANAANSLRIHAAGSAVSVLVVPTDEEQMIAMHTARVLGVGE